jgi:hypothetical protein
MLLTAGVDDDDLESLLLEHVHPVPGYHGWVNLPTHTYRPINGKGEEKIYGIYGI